MPENTDKDILETIYSREKVHKNTHPESQEVRNIIREIYRRGINNYNLGRYFTAIENFQEIWLMTYGHEKLFYKMLITVSTALLRWQDNKTRGAILAYCEAISMFKYLPNKFMGMNISQYKESIIRLFHPLLDAQGMSDYPSFPQQIPPIKLEFKSRKNKSTNK